MWIYDQFLPKSTDMILEPCILIWLLGMLGQHDDIFNPLTGTLKPQSSGPLYSNTVIGTVAVDGWTVPRENLKTGTNPYS